MDFNIQPMASRCRAGGEPFSEGDRVASFLVEEPGQPDIQRHDVLESLAAAYVPSGRVVCRWVQLCKARRPGDSTERALKLTTENLFLTLADPATEPSEDNSRLLLFLALMLERKKVLRPRGLNAAGTRALYEHARSKQIFELSPEELSPDFFIRVQEQLSVLVGVPKSKSPESKPEAPSSPSKES